MRFVLFVAMLMTVHDDDDDDDEIFSLIYLTNFVQFTERITSFSCSGDEAD